MEIKKIKVDMIDFDNSQPREHFDKIGELASNIIKNGLICPLQVMEVGNRYKLIDGERRLRALKLLRKEEVECLIIENNKKDIFLRQVSDDFHKEKLTLIEQAKAIEKLVLHGYAIQEICHLLGIQKTAYYSRLKILRLSAKSQRYIEDGRITLNDLHRLNNLDLADEERVIERIVKEKPSNEKSVKKIILEETDINYLLNDYSTNCYNFENRLKLLNERLLIFKSYLDESKIRFLKSNNVSLNDQLRKSIEHLQSILETIKHQEQNYT